PARPPASGRDCPRRRRSALQGAAPYRRRGRAVARCGQGVALRTAPICRTVRRRTHRRTASLSAHDRGQRVGVNAMSDTSLERTTTLPPLPVAHDLRRSLKRVAPALLALLIAAGGATYARHWWTVGRFIEVTDDAYAGGNVTPVSPHVAGFV